MKEAYRVEADVDRSTIYVRRPPVLRHYQPLLFLAMCALYAAIYLKSIYPLLPAACCVLAAGLVYRRTPPPYYRIVVKPTEVIVEDTALDPASTRLLLTDEKIVFRDAENEATVWHTITNLAKRDELRTLLERAVHQARSRHGAGMAEVPDTLMRSARERGVRDPTHPTSTR